MARGVTLLVLLGSLASCGTGSASPSSGTAGARCGPAAARTIALGSRGRVYVRAGSVYGCVTGTGRPVRLGATGPCQGSVHVGPVALSGRLVAYAARTCGVDTATTQVITRRLSDGRVLSTHGATDASPGPESFQSVGSIVVRANGAVGWIGSSSSIVIHRSVTEVLTVSDGLVGVLDRGPGVQVGSLTLRGATLSWVHGTARRSATLG